MKQRVQVRVPKHLWPVLMEEVKRAGEHEQVVFALAAHAATIDRTLVMVRELLFPPERAFVPSLHHGAKWSAAHNIELINRAVEQDAGILIFHYHGGAGRVLMSSDDRTSARVLLPTFHLVAPQRPHGSIILGESSSAGIVILPDSGNLTQDVQLRFFGDGITTYPLPPATSLQALIFRCQALVENVVSKRLLAATKVAVVGLSGGGSQVAAHLAAAGFGELILIDPRTVTEDNLLATDEFGHEDVAKKRSKTAVVEQRVRRVNPGVKVTPINASVPDRSTLDALKRADVIVGCLNTFHARDDLQQIAWRYMIPYVDIGLGLHPLDADDDLSEIAAISGNTHSAIPGGPCLWCCNFITRERLDAEAPGGNRAYLRVKNRRQAERASYVASFNGVLAALAATDVLHMILNSSPALALRRRYEGFAGTVQEFSMNKNAACEACSSLLGAGDPIWR